MPNASKRAGQAAVPPDRNAAHATAIEYAGAELELFRLARNWKAYWASLVIGFVGIDVIDVGAGLGENLSYLRKPGGRWLCIEPDPDMYTQLRQRVSEEGLETWCEVRPGVLADLPTGISADTILYVDVLEHIVDDAGELREAAARLRPGGHLIVLAPAHQMLYSPFDAAIGHCRRYSERALLELAPSSLIPIRRYMLDAAGLLVSVANRIVLRSGMPTRSQILFWDRVLVPVSRVLDSVLRHRTGKSLLVVWRRDDGRGDESGHRNVTRVRA